MKSSFCQKSVLCAVGDKVMCRYASVAQEGAGAAWEQHNSQDASKTIRVVKQHLGDGMVPRFTQTSGM